MDVPTMETCGSMAVVLVLISVTDLFRMSYSSSLGGLYIAHLPCASIDMCPTKSNTLYAFTSSVQLI